MDRLERHVLRAERRALRNLADVVDHSATWSITSIDSVSHRMTAADLAFLERCRTTAVDALRLAGEWCEQRWAHGDRLAPTRSPVRRRHPVTDESETPDTGDAGTDGDDETGDGEGAEGGAATGGDSDDEGGAV